MRTVVVALTTIALLTAPAYAQGRGKGGKHSGSDQTSDEQKKKNADADKAYKSAIQSIPDKKSDKPDDPWQKVR
ncbi:MAG: hypothetical protein QOI40_4736 [Alphaproteobacteria bacterium]|jgi:hypothetical protein|nr:hypothetical protein [Alphaproteobacteria bacterium]